MTNKETVNMNIGMSFDFIRQILKNPQILKNVENNSTIEFLQKDYPERENTERLKPDKYFKIKRSFDVV